MQRPILVPLDGSPFGEHALALACSLAQRDQRALHLVHVHLPFISAYVDGVPIVDEALDAEFRANDRLYLETVQQRLAADLPFTVEVLDGPVAETIVDYAARIDAALIVLTTHGRRGLVRFWLGSTADTLVRKAAQPLLLIRPHAEAPSFDQPPELRRVLIPLDGSVLAEQILEPALALGASIEAEYLLAQIVDGLVLSSAPFTARPPLPESEGLYQRQEAAHVYLDRAAQRLREQGHRVKTYVQIDDQPAAALLSVARQQHCDLIALATHGRGGLARLLLGSTADKVLRGAELPVLLYRPRPPVNHPSTLPAS